MFRASDEAEIVPPSVRRPAGHSGRSPRYAASFPGLEISDGGEFTVYKKGPAHPPKPKSCRKTRYLQLLTCINGQPRIYRDVGVVVQTNNPAFVSNSYKRDLPPFPARLILVVPVSSGHLARRLLAGPVEVTGNGRSQIRCDGGSPLSCTIILLVQRYLCSSISSPVAAPV